MPNEYVQWEVICINFASDIQMHMQEVLLNMLPFAVGIAISPVPIITAILMLFSPKPAANALGFLAGWFLGIGIPAAVVLMLAVKQMNESDTPGSATVMYVRLAAGIVLIVLALWRWRNRHQPDDPHNKPLLMRLVDFINPWKAVVVGFLFADVTNPKNMALTVAGCLAMTRAALPFAGLAMMVLLFTVIASLGVGIPVLVFLSGGEAAQEKVVQWRHWLVQHRRAVMAVLFCVFGVALIIRSGVL